MNTNQDDIKKLIKQLETHSLDLLTKGKQSPSIVKNVKQIYALIEILKIQNCF